jgi:hypothetical protein
MFQLTYSTQLYFYPGVDRVPRIFLGIKGIQHIMTTSSPFISQLSRKYQSLDVLQSMILRNLLQEWFLPCLMMTYFVIKKAHPILLYSLLLEPQISRDYPLRKLLYTSTDSTASKPRYASSQSSCSSY